MARPTDWSAIGLDGDPTPGDPVRLHAVAKSLGDLGKTAREIDTAMGAVLNKAGPDAFAGQTAEELRNQISGRLRGFVQSIAESFEWSSSALSTYADAMSSAQTTADSALEQGRGLAKDDPNRDTLATTAKNAGSSLSEAAKTATTTVRKASNNIKSPVSGCQEFWEIFQWIAIALIIPALIFGGPVALVALAVNLTLFIKTAVAFAQGKASALEFFLSALGMIAPTTRALPVLSLLSKGFQLIKNGIKAGSIAALDIFRGLLTGLTKPFAMLPSLHDLALVTGSWTKAGMLWVPNVIKAAGGLGLNIAKSGSLFVVNGFKSVPGFVRGLGPTLGNFGKASADWFKGEFGGAKWLRIILPAEGDEIGAFGVARAMKIALVDRGIFGRFRFGAVQPTVQAFGAGASHIPVSSAFPTPEAIRNVNPLVDLPVTKLADTRIQVGQWTGKFGSVTPPHVSAAPGRITGPGLSLPSPPTLTIATHLGEAVHFSLQATTRMDALLDMPIRELSSLKLGEFATTTHTVDGFTAHTGVSALPAPVAGVLSPPPVHVDVAHVAAQAGTVSPGMTQIPHEIASAGIVARATDLVMPSPTPMAHAATPPAVTPAVVAAAPPPTAVHALNPGTLATPPTVHAANPGTLTGPPPAPAHAMDPGIVAAPGVAPGASPGMSFAGGLPGAPNLTAAHALASPPNAEFAGTIAKITDGQNTAVIAHHASLDLGPAPKVGQTADGFTPPSPAITHVGGADAHGFVSAPPASPALSTPPPTSAATTAPPAFAGVDLPAPTTMSPDLAGKAGLSGTGAVGVPSSTRVDAAMNLLDGGALGHKAPAPGPVGGHGPDVPTGPGSASAGVGDKAFAGAPAHTPSPSPSAISVPEPRPGAVSRPTGKELDQAWTAHDERIGALFGAPDDVLRPQRLDAWAAFVQARYDLARAQEHLDYLHTFPGEPSSGISPAVKHVETGLDPARQQYAIALRGLREQGLNPAALDDAIADIDRLSVLDRPRLLGGAPPVIRVEGADQSRLVEVVPLSDAAGRPQSVSVHITYRPDGVDVRVDTADEPNGSGAFEATVTNDGHLVVHDVRTGFDRHFDSAGVLRSETVPLRGPDGGSLGDAVTVHYGPDGVTGHGLVSADPSRTVTPTADGGFRVDRPGLDGAGAAYQLFDGQGLHLWDGHRVRTGSADLGSVEFPAPGTTGTARWIDPDGHAVDGAVITRQTDSAIKVQNGTAGAFTRYDGATGEALELGTPLRGGGAPDGRFAVIPVNGTGAGHVEDLTGTTLPGQVLEHPGGGFRIQQQGTAYQLFDGQGLHLWDGHRIHTGSADLGSVEFPAPGTTGTARWLDPNGHTVDGFTVIRETDAAGNATTIKVQEGAAGEFTRYDIATGDTLELGTPLRGADDTTDGRFAVIPVNGTGAGHVEDLTGTTLPGQVLEHPGGGIRIQRDAGPGRPMTYQRFDGNNVHVADGRQLFAPDGTTAGFADMPVGGQVGRFLTADWQEAPGHVARIHPAVGGPGDVRVTNAAGDYRTFDVQTGRISDDAVMLKGTDGPLNQYGVTRYPAPGAQNAAPQHLGLDAAGVQLNQITFHGDDGWRLRGPNTGVRAGEYRQFGPDGSLTGQRVNVIENGAVVQGRYLELNLTPNGGTWRLLRADGTAVPGLLHSGKVEMISDAGRIRLIAKPGTTSVEIFARRPLPGGGFVDAIRRTDVNGFGRWTGGQRTRWTQYTANGTVTGWGVRKFGTLDSKVWQDVDRWNRTVHEFRKGINGNVFAHKTGDNWSWTRYDKADRVPIASGVRTHDLAGGWTDRLGDAAGPVVQRLWGPGQLPRVAGHYREIALDAQGLPKAVTINRDGQTITKHLWNEQSPQSKSTGALEQVPGGSIVEWHRWSEQRPPQWVRRGLIGIDERVWDAHPYVRKDTRYQMSTWTRTDLATGAETHGFRFTSMNEGTLDIAADGRFIAGSMKLGNGNTLKVGDTVPLPPGAQLDARFMPWSEGPGKLSGHRVQITGAPDGRIWEDRFDPAAGGGDWYHPNANANWQVARVGYADGTVREFKIGAGNVVDADLWVLKDPHGAIIGRSDRWSVDGTPHRIEMTVPNDTRLRYTGYDGRTDSQRWHWTDHDAGGGVPTMGPARYMRGYNGATPFDDSFIQFIRGDQGIEAIRVRNVLGGGHYVDSWRVTAADGTHTWQWAKYDKAGTAVDYPGTHVREWWDPKANGGRGSWSNDWVKGAERFRDVLSPHHANAAPIVVREVPVTAVNNRIREYLPQGEVAPPAGKWQEFDHGGVVRERDPLPGGGFLEKDAWLGQWRRYDAAGNIVAQRTSSGFVFEVDGAGRFRLTGRELNFRGPLTEVRGWGRRIREANRLEWKFAPSGGPHVGEATYKPQLTLIAEKAAIEFLQEFILEFTANLAANAIIDAIQNKPFTGKDALKAFANASVSSGIKIGVGALVHDNRLGPLRHTGDWRMGLSNIDSGKPWNRHPFNHDKHWANEWAGNETPIRWRSGTYDFSYNAGVSVLSGWVNGSMNAAVFGFVNANGDTVKVTGGWAALDGLINAASSATGTMLSTGLGKNLFMYSVGGRGFHRQGVGEFVAQFAFKLPEKLTTWRFTNLFRAGFNPPWYQAPAPNSHSGGTGGPGR